MVTQHPNTRSSTTKCMPNTHPVHVQPHTRNAPSNQKAQARVDTDTGNMATTSVKSNKALTLSNHTQPEIQAQKATQCSPS